MNNFKQSQIEKALHKIRLDEIAAKETYFAEDFAVPDRLKEFEFKYEKFRENDVDFKQNKTQHLDNQYKLIKQICPDLQIEDLTMAVISQATLIYIQELVESSKEQAIRNNNPRITTQDVQEVVRLQEFHNSLDLNSDLGKFF
ncbi:hypothetical protein pb186bvf_013504 [Paramecium bursaria]